MSILNVNNQTSNGVKKKIAISVCVTVSFFVFDGFVFAEAYSPLAPLPGTFDVATGKTDLSTYLSGAVKLLIAIGAVFSVLVAIIGGTQYVASGIAPSAKQDAKERITNALIGLALVLASYLILNSINPTLLSGGFTLPGVGTAVAPTGPATHLIVASASDGGTINPTGGTTVTNGSSQTYSIAPDSGYNIFALYVDGTSIATSTSYAFSSITADHTIRAAFIRKVSLVVPPPTFTITATSGSNGTVAPPGVTTVADGGSQTYTITPSTGYGISTLVIDGSTATTASSYVFNYVNANHTISATFGLLSSTPPVGLDPTNDYSIITKCVGNTTYSLCLKTDLNGDGETDSTDVNLFITRGGNLDVNRNKTVELADLPTPTSCFFRTSTANIQGMLPRPQKIDETPAPCGWTTGNVLPPTVACNGATWIKASLLESTCAPQATIFDSVLYYGNGPYDKFKNWIIDSSLGGRIDLTTLFEKTFFDIVTSEELLPTRTYTESDTGKITYATIAQYDLNNDGFADFSASGDDMMAFNSCKGSAVSGVCAQADFSGDGVIDGHDVAVGRTTQQPVVGSVADLVNNKLSSVGATYSPIWTIGDFESYFFDPTGYSDKQIISYWIGRYDVYGIRIGDLNKDKIVNSDDLTVFNAGAPLLDFNGDGKVDLALAVGSVLVPATASLPVGVPAVGSTPTVINDPSCPSGYTQTTVPITWPAHVDLKGPKQTMNHCEVNAYQFTMPDRVDMTPSMTFYADVPKYLTLSKTAFDFAPELEATGCAAEGYNNAKIWNSSMPSTDPYMVLCLVEPGATYYLNVRNASSRDGADNCQEGSKCTFYLSW